MLNLVIPGQEFWDEAKQEFVYSPDVSLVLEHSLLSISKWESKWHKSFLSGKNKTEEEVLDYIKCMTVTPNVKDEVYNNLSVSNVNEIQEYINNPMTATTFTKQQNQKPNREVLTSELIYYYMVELGIPFECQKWHLNRLLTLIQVCSIKNQPSKKMSKNDVLRSNASLNAARRRAMNTHG